MGPIDLLAWDQSNNYVVIELKKGRASDRVIGRTSRYMGWVRQNLARSGEGVRGIIVGHDIDKKLVLAAAGFPAGQVSLRNFRFRFQFSEVRPGTAAFG